jgi:uncharacterized protein YraI
MQPKALSLAAALPLVGAYPITADGVNCRAGPGTSYSAITSYALGTDVQVTCQVNGEDIFGTTIWDKTSDGCYVSDYYVKTGSDSMVEPECEASDPGDGSEYNGPISRQEILSRADFWVSQGIPYSMERTEPDPTGRAYRTDCSGFVSMTLHAMSPGYNTVSLPEIATAITYDEIQAGDFVGTLGAGTGGAAGHVVLFASWTDDTKTAYNTLECKGGDGCVAYVRSVGWSVGEFVSAPYRYNNVSD